MNWKQGVVKTLVWLAHYAADHPDQVVAVAQAVADAKKAKP